MTKILTPDEMKQVEILKELDKRVRTNRMTQYVPNDKQKDFHALGRTKNEVALVAANQVGKTFGVSHEVAYHLTGRYPDWWAGRRFPHAIRAWLASIDLEFVRDNAQKHLLGTKAEIGTGTIPKECLVGEPLWASGSVRDVADTIYVRHSSGGISSLKIKSYKAGVTDFAGETIHLGWADEECDMDIYMEFITRLRVHSGLMLVTLTPLKGETPLVRRFTSEVRSMVAVVGMTIFDATHYTEAQRQAAIEQYPEHERGARLYGIASKGSGMVFPLEDSEITCDPFPIPDHWFVLAAMDFTHSSSGDGHPFALIWMAYNRDTDEAYVYDEYVEAGKSTGDHVVAWRDRGDSIPVAWPADGLRTEAGSNGVQLAQSYKNAGMLVLDEQAMLPEADIGQGKESKSRTSVEAGVKIMLDAMRSGRFKVFRTCQKWLQERRSYFRDEKGQIKRIRDDAISASRYNYVSRRFAVPKGQAQRTIRLAPMKYSRYS